MTHDDIRAEFRRLGLDDGDGMMLLADSLCISDNAISVEDINEADIPDAVAWLKKQQP